MQKLKTLDLHFLQKEQAIASFLLPISFGVVLVETGPYSTLPMLETQLAQYGYSLSDVKHVFLSHIHFDHAGAAWYFAKHNDAIIYVHPAGATHLSKPEKLYTSAKRIYGDAMETLWGAMEPIAEKNICVVEHGTSVYIDNIKFVAWHTPGHAVHHIAWQLQDLIFAGDVAGCKIGEGPVVPPCPPPDIDVEAWVESLELLKALTPKALYLTHFGKVTDVTQHLDSLTTILLDWANWIKPHHEANTPLETLIPLFEHYTKQQLLAANVSETDIAIYEAANPSWMSVAGLLRYWKKKAVTQTA